MGQREATLSRILGSSPGNAAPPRPSEDAIRKLGLFEDVTAVYVALGGVRPQPRIAPGGWDIVLDDYCIELDEERHFNRYRAATLHSSLYSLTKHFDVASYVHYCDRYEPQCLQAAGWRRNWASPSSEREFGPSSPPRDLSAPGSARWKQRAFYDFIKDLAPRLGVRLIRVAVWEVVVTPEGKLTLAEALRRATTSTHHMLADAIRDAVFSRSDGLRN